MANSSEASKFIGRQLARVKFTRDYLTVIFFGITAISTTSEYLKLPTDYFFPLLIIGVIFSFAFGYFVDKTGIREHDQALTLEQNIEGSKTVNETVWREAIAPVEWEMLHEPLYKKLEEILQVMLSKQE